jgi:hypothetical protein
MREEIVIDVLMVVVIDQERVPAMQKSIVSSISLHNLLRRGTITIVIESLVSDIDMSCFTSSKIHLYSVAIGTYGVSSNELQA